MNLFFDLTWRAYPAAVLIVLGSALVLHGVRRVLRPPHGTIDALTYALGFRATVAGICIALIGLAWLQRLPWLLAIGLGIGGEELFETTNIIRALQQRPLAPSGVAGRRRWVLTH